ncbi:hypothetical protein [Enterococcus wangshanyuanii]|uniref:Uncharacterized protein n=1 Tax=Enterococcus wangshanyuanii TaxID=2005703 RepID=A0ABQ1PRX1_9ENTE|nr:hypothetical protein [Enterococcus wangshanyuanii]GGD02155.1 hypothetical protein GCM10011573_34570 [Enterococcus wangshanyuanii]
MRAMELLTILSVDFQHDVVQDIKVELQNKIAPIGKVEQQEGCLVLMATDGNMKPLTTKEIVTTLMLNKSLQLVKKAEISEPIYGCRVVDRSLIL